MLDFHSSADYHSELDLVRTRRALLDSWRSSTRPLHEVLFHRAFAVLLFTITLLQPAAAYVGSPSIAQLRDEADIIILGNVTGLHFDGRDTVATASIREIWKGRWNGIEVRYRASASWVCDISHAVLGETVVLFLSRGADSGLARRAAAASMVITHHGRGRLIVIDRGRTRYLTTNWNIVPRSWPKLLIPSPPKHRDFLSDTSCIVPIDNVKRLCSPDANR